MKPTARPDTVQKVGLREEKKQETREALFQHAIARYREVGFDEARVQDVASQVRVSLKTFYNYFPTKDAILDEFVIRVLDDFRTRAEAALANDETPVRLRLDQLILNLAEPISLDTDFSLTVLRRSKLFRAEGAMLEKEMESYRLLAEIFRQGQERGEIRAGIAPLAIAESLLATYYFTTHNWLAGWRDDSESLVERLSVALELFHDGCAEAKARPRPRGKKSARRS